MKIVMVHGAPGVGKFTVARELAARVEFRLLHYHAFGSLFGPLFGYGTPEFVELRDRLYPELVRAAARHRLPGVVSTFIFEPTVKMRELQTLWDEIGAEVFFVGLTCAEPEHRRRVENRQRGKLGGIDDFSLLEQSLSDGVFALPALPEPSITIDTTELAPAVVASTVVDALPAGWDLALDRRG